ncbi:MAG: dihydrofolate reductase [Gammaproteobacteria bacterium]
MRINIVVAISENEVIGRKGALPWRLPADLKRFKSVTMGHPLIMGRKTHESIGRALPGRVNIVVSRQSGFTSEGCEVVASLDAALGIAGSVDEVMVVGGAALYAAALVSAERIYLTRVHVDIAGDTLFPRIDWAEWKEITTERYSADDRDEFDYSFITLDRISTLQKQQQ